MLYSDLRLNGGAGNANANTKETLRVSRLCFGSLCIGPLQSGFTAGEGAKVITRALRLGVNFIDAAQIYGTYPHIKAALDICPEKNKIIISTKTYAHTRKLAKDALDEALRGLGRDAVDIFLLHEQESVHTIYGHIEALEYLFEQKKAGVIKAVGISTHHVAGVLGAIEFNRTYKHKPDKLDVLHPMYNIAGLGIIADGPDGSVGPGLAQMESALAEAKNSGFFIFSMKALGGGNLFAQAEEALGFVLDKSYIDSVAVGMKSEEEVRANVNFVETGKFTAGYYKNYKSLQKQKRLHIDNWCEGCGKCAAVCPSRALEISGEGKAVCDGGKCVLCGYCARACGCFALKII